MTVLLDEYVQDIGDQPIERIFRETALKEDSHFHIVEDLSPIVPSHLLLLSKVSYLSIADYNIHNEIDLVNVFHNLYSKWLFCEKGRASFCTSFNTSKHAHGHLFDLKEIDDGIFNSLEDFMLFEDITKAYNFLSDYLGEYILIASSETKVFVLIEPDSRLKEKRFIRNLLTKLSLN